MSSPSPRVTVIMPAFNREKYIAESIRSVLAQTFKDFELVVIDDGSEDRTLEIARGFTDPRIRVIKNEKNMGIARTRNKGLDIAQGEYIALLDSDDVWLKNDKLERQVKFLDSNPEYAIVGGGIEHIDPNGNVLKKALFADTDQKIRRMILKSNQFAQSTLMYRKSIIRKCGAYSTDYIVCDDLNLWLCVGAKHKFANLPEVLTGYRIHGGNITRTKRLTAAREILEIVRNNSQRYPHAWMGVTKAYLRLILAYVRT